MAPAQERPIARVVMTRISRLATRVPQPPRTPPPAPQVRSSLAPPVMTKRPHGKAPVAAPAAATAAPRAAAKPVPSASPVATPSPAGPCAGHANAAAALAGTPPPLPVPGQARVSRVNGVAQVQVSLAADGSVSAVALVRSSGDGGLDAVASEMARLARYSPKYVDCKAVAGTYAFRVRFFSW
jgi:protein TonB